MSENQNFCVYCKYAVPKSMYDVIGGPVLFAIIRIYTDALIFYLVQHELAMNLDVKPLETLRIYLLGL